MPRPGQTNSGNEPGTDAVRKWLGVGGTSRWDEYVGRNRPLILDFRPTHQRVILITYKIWRIRKNSHGCALPAARIGLSHHLVAVQRTTTKHLTKHCCPSLVDLT